MRPFFQTPKFSNQKLSSHIQKVTFLVYNFMWKCTSLRWQKSPNAVYLRSNCQVHSGFSMTKNPWLVFRMKHKVSKQKLFGLFHYEAKMCILCIVCGFHKAKIRFVAESKSLLLFFDFLCCYEFRKQILKTLFRSKSLRKETNLRNPQP